MLSPSNPILLCSYSKNLLILNNQHKYKIENFSNEPAEPNIEQISPTFHIMQGEKKIQGNMCPLYSIKVETHCCEKHSKRRKNHAETE